MAKCSIEGCELQTYGDSDKCILHCEKDESFVEAEDVAGFYEAFKKAGGSEEGKILYKHIVFPIRAESHDWQGIITYNMQIQGRSFLGIVFKSCIFLDNINMRNGQSLDDILLKKSSFYECTFNKRWKIVHSSPENFGISYSGVPSNYEDCKIKIDAKTEIPIPNAQSGKGTKWGSIIIQNMDLYKQLIVVPHQIHINDILLHNTAFEGLFDCSNQQKPINSLNISSCEFKHNVSFYNCSFDNKVTFKDVYFIGLVNFQKAKFNGGLDLDNVIFEKTPNFLGAKVDFENTTRETFRIIKDSFDKVGNHIEANKFYALEMKKREEELKNTKWYDPEKFVFNFNGFISDFGQSWIKPFRWLLLLLFIGWASSFLVRKDIISCATLGICSFVNELNEFAKPLSIFFKWAEGREFVGAILAVLLSVCIWHIAVAFRRHNRR